MPYRRILEYLHSWRGYHVDLIRFLELFMRHYADLEGLGLTSRGTPISLSTKGKKSDNHPNDLVALVPDRSARRRSSRHAPRPIELIFGLTALNEAQNLWYCHILPKLPPAFQELMLRRLQDASSVPDELWIAFDRAVLWPLARVFEGRRVSSLVEGQFNDHLWRLNADWTQIRVEWIVATKRTAYEDPDDALWQYVLCLFQDNVDVVERLLGTHDRQAFNVIYAYVDLPPQRRASAEFLAKFFELSRAESFMQALQHPLFHAGVNARRGIVAGGPTATPYEKNQVVALGVLHGCHHCGHVHPQPKWAAQLNYWILDHQPPRSKNFRVVMEQGIFLVGPVLTNDFIYDLSLYDEFTVYDDLRTFLREERVVYRSRDGTDHDLTTYVTNTRKALAGMLTAMSTYVSDTPRDEFFRFFLHCHDCAGRQGGLIQAIVKVASEILRTRKRMYPKDVTRLREKAYYLQCIAQLYDLLAEAFDVARPLIRLGARPGGPVSIGGSAATGTSEHRETLVRLSHEAQEGLGTQSALGLENPLVLHTARAACHSCRATVPVPRELWTADHVAPSVLIELGLRQGPQILYPQCIYCRKAQSVLAAGFKRCWQAATTAEEWDERWSTFLRATEGGWINPLEGDEDEELLDDAFDGFGDDADDDQPLPMTGGGVETPLITRVACLRQEVNTCGQRAAYNAAMLAQHHGNAATLKAALENDAALRGIGPMHIDVADNDVRNMLNTQAGGQHIAIVSSLARLPVLRGDASNVAEPADQLLYDFMHGIRADLTLVLNTHAATAGPSLDTGGKGKAKIGHYIAVRLVRTHAGIAATYADSLLNPDGCRPLIEQLVALL